MINPSDTKIELNVRTVRNVLIAFKKTYGQKELTKLLDKSGIPIDYFNDENNWVSYNYFSNLLTLMTEYSGDPELPYKFGLSSATNLNWGIIATISTSFFSTAFAYKSVIGLSPRWQKIAKFQFLNFKKNSGILQLRYLDNFKQNKNNCLNTQGQLASVPTVFNLPPAKIKETQCAAEGADSCIYELSWQNPPTKKTGLYFFLIGVIISYLLYEIKINYNNQIISIIPWTLLIIAPIIIFFIRRIIINKEILKKNSEHMEKQNEALTDNLVDIEQFNELLQQRVEERTGELLKANEELKQKLQDLKDNEIELFRKEKMSNVGKVAVDISNKLKSPITEIQKSIDQLMEKDNDELATDLLQSARKAADRCDRIVKDLLTFSDNGTASQLSDIDINDIIENSIKEFSLEISETGIELIKDLENNLPKIKADPGQLKQILMILLGNAYDAIDNLPDKVNSSITIKSSLNNNNIIIQIIDTGCGIPKEMMDKIFDPFFSTKISTRRKGMGLTLTYNIIKRLGGKIEVESIPDKGTTFNISLPIMDNIH